MSNAKFFCGFVFWLIWQFLFTICYWRRCWKYVVYLASRIRRTLKIRARKAPSMKALVEMSVDSYLFLLKVKRVLSNRLSWFSTHFVKFCVSRLWNNEVGQKAMSGNWYSEGNWNFLGKKCTKHALPVFFSTIWVNLSVLSRASLT